MLILYSLFYCALYCTRLNLANAGPQMMAELGFRAADIGVLTATLFWAYAIGMLLGGRLSEMVGPSRFIMLSTVLTILMNVLFGFTNSLPLMAVLWAINGFAQALNWPSGCEILANWWPGKTRSSRWQISRLRSKQPVFSYVVRHGRRTKDFLIPPTK